MNKTCGYCKKSLPVNLFYRNKRGLLSWCKNCYNNHRQKRARQWKCVCCDSIFFTQRTNNARRCDMAECVKLDKHIRHKRHRQKPEEMEKARIRARARTLAGYQKISDSKRRRGQNYRRWLREYKKRPHVRLRNRIQRAIKLYAVNDKGSDKGSPLTTKLTGCSMKFLQAHIESQWERWMNWQNYGVDWVIDHIIPLASFDLTQESEQKKAFHWTNLRPLEREENLRKSDSIIECQPGLLLEFA